MTPRAIEEYVRAVLPIALFVLIVYLLVIQPILPNAQRLDPVITIALIGLFGATRAGSGWQRRSEIETRSKMETTLPSDESSSEPKA